MVKRLIKAFIILGLFIIYIILANILILNFYEKQPVENEKNIIEGRGVEVVSVGDSVSIIVERQRWYGEIIENNELSILYLFNKIQLPIKKSGTSFVFFHYLFLSLIVIIPIYAMKGGKQKNEKVVSKELGDYYSTSY